MLKSNTAVSLIKVGDVVAVSGEIVARIAHDMERRLQMSDPVYLNDYIRSGDNGHLVLEFIDGTELELGRNAVVVIDSEVVDIDGMRLDIDISASPSIVKKVLHEQKLILHK